MSKSIVAVVGRPNVGKSTFFNKVAGKRISIVEDTPGVTRDRIYAEAEWLGNSFTLIDTGGIEPFSKDIILQQMRLQAELAIETADVIIFMVDGREGITAADYEVANMLRKSNRPTLLVVNKIETKKLESNIFEFYNLGLGDPIAISAKQGLGLGDLLDEVVKLFPKDKKTQENEDRLRIAVIGKPNAGKSTLINKLLGEERVIVSHIAGTTRDAIDTPFQYNGENYILIDTAGIRRKSRIRENVEKYSVIRSFTGIERSDVCLLMIDAQEGVTEQDTKIAGYAHEEGKAIIIIVNKWDLIEKDSKTMDQFRKEIREKLSFMSYAPILFISAKTGQRIHKIMELVDYVSNQHSMRISTGMLNEIIGEAILLNQPPADKGKRLNILYATQASVKPPTFILFVNDINLMHFSYQRYIENQIRKSFGFEGTPIRFIIRQKND
ncbi:ribosome biogenesis GTPase Der [Garciella nitratireducens]|uniref:GTPase Der n=1 Tax=Garciella nitratireducens DSM 15102 TaxID=1121911 RepID=A0A1T4K031_9FIRM|nr:ribosome biogenesis GTPase Der [Garciella nitratireducens]SJZ35729.1 GTP-binding protein [Garciella nitratireducens DSM 15102]